MARRFFIVGASAVGGIRRHASRVEETVNRASAEIISPVTGVSFS
jgi:hypothetical protein